MHCAEFGSVFEKLATVFEDEPTVLVATIDAALNRDIAERYDVSGRHCNYFQNMPRSLL